MTRINRPGPKATSCLTCKNRHQKCDRRLPRCERCQRKGLDCLGYGYISDTRPRESSLRTQPTLSLPRPPRAGGSGYSGELPTVSSSQGGLPEAALTPAPSLAVDTNVNTRNEIHNTWFSDTGSNASPDLWTANDLALCQTKSISLTSGPMSTFRNLAGLYLQLPRYSFNPLKIFFTNPSFDYYLWTQYTKLAGKWYFKPANMHKQTFEQCIAHPLQTSPTDYSRWIALISLGICEALLTEDGSQDQLHSLWIKYIEGSLRRELSYDTASRDLQSRRRDWVHVSLLSTLVIHSSDVYQVLRSVSPAFLQSAFSNPALWPSGSNPAYIPLMSVLTVGSHELAYFALIDCTCAMTLGVPQLVEYNTTIYAPNATPSHQWAHGSPTEFQVVLAEINACRDKSPAARDWREIERWLLEWRSRPGEHTFTESWMTVAWYAVQESWRLALLVYLYLAVCGNASDDPRIQTYVKQLLQVLGTVKERESTSAEVPFLVQYLVAGICARSEAQRKVVFSALENTKQPKMWIMRGSDFLPVLDHLWHGAAVGGRPVNWSDYMRSREAALPVLL
ncbi:hypothetical protein ACGC1H_005977 [Rhizoctonia solani]